MPADRDRQEKSQCVIHVNIGFVVAGGLEKFDDEDIVERRRLERPDDAQADIAHEFLSFDFFQKHPERERNAERQNIPADLARGDDGEKDKA